MLIQPKKTEHYKTKHQKQFWSCISSNLNKKVENYKLQRIKIFWKAYIKMEKFIKFGGVEIQNQNVWPT